MRTLLAGAVAFAGGDLLDCKLAAAAGVALVVLNPALEPDADNTCLWLCELGTSKSR